MPEKRVHVWVTRFKDRKSLMLQWTDPESKRTKSRSAGTDDAKEAEKAREDLQYELNHNLHRDASRMSWDAFRKLFEAEYASARRLSTQRGYQATLDAFEDIVMPKRLDAVSARILSKFQEGLRKGKEGRKPAKASTVKLRLQLLRTVLRWAVGQKMLPECPKFPKVKVPKTYPQPVPAEMFERLYGKAPDAQTKAFLLCGWLAGLRRSEALALERELSDGAPYLDLPHQRIVLPASFAKADEDQWVPLDPVLHEALSALPGNGKRFFHFIAKDGHALEACTIGQRVSVLAAKAGLKLTYHSLRKGFGCRYAGKVPAQVLQRLMRHADIATTMDYYVNVDLAVREAVLGASLNSFHNSLAETVPVLPDEADVNGSVERRNREA
jgi:integrase